MPVPPTRDASGWEPVRTYRCADPLYQAMQRATADNGETITDVIIRAFERYVREWPGNATDASRSGPS